MAATSRTTAPTSASSTSIPSRFFSSNNGYEKRFDLHLFRDDSLENYIAKINTLFLYTKGWTLSDTEFHLISLVILLTNFYDI